MAAPGTTNQSKTLWQVLRSPSVRYSLLTLLGGGFIAGIIFWGGFNTVLEATNRMEFCVGCHEMRDNVFAEYKKTINYTNRSGVRVACSDCHVPKDIVHKLKRKIEASKEVWGKITGIIDTREKFEAHRLEMATNEWDKMKDNDSRACRTCHVYDAMDPEKQGRSAQKKHAAAAQPGSGKTCIDCHKGIAHDMPKEAGEAGAAKSVDAPKSADAPKSDDAAKSGDTAAGAK